MFQMDVQSRAIQVLIKGFIEENTDTDKNYWHFPALTS